MSALDFRFYLAHCPDIMTMLATVGLLLAAGVVLASLDLGDENKMSYCAMLIKRRVYREENLDVFCLLKVQQWDNQAWL